MKYDHNNQHLKTGWVLHIAGCALVLVVVGASYRLGFVQFVDQHEAYAGRTEQLNTLSDTASEVYQLHQLQRAELDKLVQLTTAMRSRLPNKIQKQEFELSVEQIAEKVNLTIGNTTWSVPQVAATHTSVELVVRGTGSFAGICEFLDEINQLARIAKVSSLDVESAADSSHYPFQITFALVYGVESHDTTEREGKL